MSFTEAFSGSITSPKIYLLKEKKIKIKKWSFYNGALLMLISLKCKYLNNNCIIVSYQLNLHHISYFIREIYSSHSFFWNLTIIRITILEESCNLRSETYFLIKFHKKKNIYLAIF